MINHASVAFSITPVFSLGQAPQLNQLQDKQLAEHVTKVHSSFEKKARRSHRISGSDFGLDGVGKKSWTKKPHSIDVVNWSCFIIDVRIVFGHFLGDQEKMVTQIYMASGHVHWTNWDFTAQRLFSFSQGKPWDDQAGDSPSYD